MLFKMHIWTLLHICYFFVILDYSILSWAETYKLSQFPPVFSDQILILINSYMANDKTRLHDL